MRKLSSGIVIKTATQVRETMGGVSSTFATKLTTGASIRQLSGNESVSNGADTSFTTSSFELRQTPATLSITTQDIIETTDGNEWDIVEVDTVSFQNQKVVKIKATLRR